MPSGYINDSLDKIKRAKEVASDFSRLVLGIMLVFHSECDPIDVRPKFVISSIIGRC
jgi:hypothetical protein